jgi:elongation factor P--(R)-beta-lysine ligase
MVEIDDDKVLSVIRARHEALKAIREFFYQRGYLEVETPYLTKFAPSDPYIEPLRVYVEDSGPYYLHTSPEIGMKLLLAEGVEKIFQICKVFRVEEFEERHGIEFTMVEWYRPGTYVDAMEETRKLVWSVSEAIGAGKGLDYVRRPWRTYELRALIVELTGIDPLPLSYQSLLAVLRARGLRGLDTDNSWADLFFRLLVQEVEPRLLERERGPYFIKDWPASLTAMARKKDEHTVERFELYIHGLEIANGYSELLDREEQRRRIFNDNEARRRQRKSVFPPDDRFLRSLARISGPVSGVSVGIDRLLMVILEKEMISDVLTDRFTL